MEIMQSDTCRTYSIEHADNYGDSITIKNSFTKEQMKIPICVLEEFFAERIRHDQFVRLK